MSTLAERTMAIIAEQLRVDASLVTPKSHLVDDLKADSLDVVDLAIALEEEFGTDERPIEISDEVAADLRVVQDVIDFLEQQGVT